ncbi:glycosyltransferase [Phycicoccus sp. CSK15P-2]|uniref:glycosyltransferase n=1 Tax=Phycicoccus sp. CSK15P-2 TaxID=2807627 RepID=UPI0019502B51|nr:glycosyltransferase [Phycicoccus sp. CSK15P-2]MBM6404436.1 glycosyltransferase [Phycicoccus sp. CSK15P-2]
MYARAHEDRYQHAPSDDDTVAGRLGEALVADGRLTQGQLAEALQARTRTGSTLASVLIATGAVRRRDVYEVLARVWGRPFIDLTTTELDRDLLRSVAFEELVARHWLPVRRLPGGDVLVATSVEPSRELLDDVESTLGGPAELHVTTEWDLSRTVIRAHHDVVADRATMALWERDTDQSARQVANRTQKVVGGVSLAVLVVLLVLAPRATLIALSAVGGFGFLVSVAFKFVVCLAGARLDWFESITEEDLAGMSDEDLPSYTVLVPVFREANVVAHLIENLGALDYPPEKLQILLLLEQDDDETREAALASRPPETITLLTVPRGAPQTKPRACNVGLFFATGDCLVIYDAEDKPDPDQLRKAAVAFDRGEESLVCVQAALNYWNAEENALTRMFTLEYSFWFDYMLPGLDLRRMPIPLGGTSNHFRTAALRSLGGWDPFNVTEDADLGIRAAALGTTVGVINSTTFEEANRAYGNFVRQRSRWIKGYMQTTLVHLRHPVRLVRTVGWRATIGFALLVGGTPLSFLLVPPLYLAFVLSLLVPPDALSPYFPGWVLWVALLNLLVGNVLMIYVSMMGAFKRRRYRLVPWALLNPLYWLLHSVASYKALWQLVTRPHYWEKTDHGLSALGGGDAGPADRAGDAVGPAAPA